MPRGIMTTPGGCQDTARRRLFVASLAAAQREIERNRAAQIRAQAAAVRETQRARAAYERAVRADERERKKLYQESRAADVAANNSDIETSMSVLTGLLAATLARDDYIDLETLKEQPRLPTSQHQNLEVAEAAPVIEQLMPPRPSGMTKIFGGQKKYAAAVADAQLIVTGTRERDGSQAGGVRCLVTLRERRWR
jgi:restriction system protein